MSWGVALMWGTVIVAVLLGVLAAVKLEATTLRTLARSEGVLVAASDRCPQRKSIPREHQYARAWTHFIDQQCARTRCALKVCSFLNRPILRRCLT
jgi:hypothetical protein